MDLTKTKRWKEFEAWYDIQFYIVPLKHSYNNDFLNLPFEFQEGVYRKFIESNTILRVNDEYEDSHWLEGKLEKFNTFQELVEWFFTNE